MQRELWPLRIVNWPHHFEFPLLYNVSLASWEGCVSHIISQGYRKEEPVRIPRTFPSRCAPPSPSRSQRHPNNLVPQVGSRSR